MAKRILEGYYNEETLQEMLHNEEISSLTYVCHHSEKRKMDFISFCSERGINIDERAAEQFIEHKLNEEVNMHSDNID